MFHLLRFPFSLRSEVSRGPLSSLVDFIGYLHALLLGLQVIDCVQAALSPSQSCSTNTHVCR